MSHVYIIINIFNLLLPLVEKELHTIPEHLNSPTVFSGVRVTRTLDFCVVFCRSLFVLLSFFFGHCVVYRFWLPLWYLQTLLHANIFLTFLYPFLKCWHNLNEPFECKLIFKKKKTHCWHCKKIRTLWTNSKCYTNLGFWTNK